MAGLDNIWQVCVAIAVCVQQAALLFRSLREQRERSRCRARRGHSRCLEEGGGTHALDYHGATPIGGLGPSYLFHVVDHHGADAVRVPIAATGEGVAVSLKPCLSALGRHREDQCSPLHLAQAPLADKAVGDRWGHQPRPPSLKKGKGNRPTAIARDPSLGEGEPCPSPGAPIPGPRGVSAPL